jgi:hypothetical protein
MNCRSSIIILPFYILVICFCMCALLSSSSSVSSSPPLGLPGHFVAPPNDPRERAHDHGQPGIPRAIVQQPRTPAFVGIRVGGEVNERTTDPLGHADIPVVVHAVTQAAVCWQQKLLLVSVRPDVLQGVWCVAVSLEFLSDRLIGWLLD